MGFWQLDASLRSAISVIVFMLICFVVYLVASLYSKIKNECESHRKGYIAIIRRYCDENKKLKSENAWLKESFREIERR